MAAMMSFHAENCCHLVSEHKVSGHYQFWISRTFVLVPVTLVKFFASDDLVCDDSDFLTFLPLPSQQHQLCLMFLQVLKNADEYFKVGSGHWVTITGRTDKDDFDLTVASL